MAKSCSKLYNCTLYFLQPTDIVHCSSIMAKSCPKLYNLSSLLSTTCGHDSLPLFSADHVYTRQQNEADRLRKGQAVRQVRQQLSQERRLKREAFHQVDELATEVRT